jgi:tetratricopeptide (TPR) repeat protein
VEQQQATETNLTEPKSTEVTLSEAKAKKAKAAEAKLMSISIAMVMAIVAMLGAVTAYRAALAEQDTLGFERRLQQGEMLELVKRQELLSKLSSGARYENSASLHTPEADSDQEQAGKLAAPDRRQAALKKLQAEEEAAYVRDLQPYRDYFHVGVQPRSDLETPIAMETAIAWETANWLRNIGFDTVWEPPAADGSFPSIWENLENDVKWGRTKVLLLAVAVVLFVLALAFLTFAQLSHNKPKREKVLARIGGVLAAAVLIMAWGADPGSWKAFAGFGVGFALLWRLGAPLARRFHFVARAEAEESSPSPDRVSPANSAEGREDEEDEPVHPAEVDPALFAGMRLHTAPVAHKFGRFVICMIALSAILSALSGYFYSLNAARSSEAIGAALENQAELFRMNSLQVTVWNYMVGRVATAEDHHLRYEAARQRLELAKEEPDLLSVKDAMDQVQRRRKTLEKFEKKEPKAHQLMTGPQGPEQDVHFPWKMVIFQSSHDPAKTFAQWSANNEKSLGYQKKATTFLALLTLFAIALYLLGQALGMGRTRDAFILVLFACGLVFAGAMGGLLIGFADKAITLQPASAECRLPGYSDRDLVELAAEHYARGRVLDESSPDDPVESAKAAKEFQCAAQIRPKFALANFYFALATHRANTPQLNESTFVSLISKKALDTVSQAEQQARDVLKEQGFAPPMDLVGDYGFDMYADGLVKGDRRRVEIGRQATLAAIDLDTNNLATRFNLGVAQLAEGHEKEALETYRQAIALGKPGKEPFVTDDAAVIGAVIGGAITDLDVFRQYCTGLNDAAYCKRFENTDLPRLKSELVAAAWPSAKGRTLAGSGIKLTDLQLRGSAAGLGWSGLVENLPQGPPGKEQDALAVLWYAYSPDWKAWRVLPAISVRVEPALYAQGYSRRFRSALRASDARICLQSGTYRAEFYVDGELAGSQEITLKDENLHPEMFPDLDVAICRPPSWQRWQSRDPDAVWIRGFIEDSQNRGVFVFAFFDPQQDGKEVTEQRALRRAQNILHTEGLAPKLGAARPLSDCTGLRGRPGAAMAAFGDGGGASIARAWTTKEGLVNVVAVVDKHLEVTGLVTEAPSQSQAHQDCEILLSATTVHR